MAIRNDGEWVLQASVGELLGESMVSMPFGVYGGAFYLSRAVAEAHFRAELEWQDTKFERQRDYYYVRVFQRNGQAAWSSPIWVERA